MGLGQNLWLPPTFTSTRNGLTPWPSLAVQQGPKWTITFRPMVQNRYKTGTGVEVNIQVALLFFKKLIFGMENCPGGFLLSPVFALEKEGTVEALSAVRSRYFLREHLFESKADSGASKTYPQKVGTASKVRFLFHQICAAWLMKLLFSFSLLFSHHNRLKSNELLSVSHMIDRELHRQKLRLRSYFARLI